MSSEIDDIHKNSPEEVRGRHFKILRSQFYVLLCTGSINIFILASEKFFPTSLIAQQKANVLPITIPIILIMIVLIAKKLNFLKQRTNFLVDYVDKIRNDESKFRSLFNGSSDGHLLIHPENGIIEFNEAFKNLVHISNNDRKQLSDYMSSAYRTDESSCLVFSDFVNEAMVRGSASGFWILKTHQDTLVYTKINIKKIYVQNSVQFMITIHDETENELRQNQLKMITSKAVEATKAKSEFLANITHELRTPLNGIIGLSDDLLLNENSEKIQDEVKIINESGKSLLGLISNVLDYSKLDAQKVVLENIPVKLMDLEKILRNTLYPLAERKGISLSINIDHKLPSHFMGDKIRLQQVLINLIGNAIKFTSVGKVVLKVVCEEIQATNLKMGFYIYDTGVGIPKESIPKLFNSFEQVDNTTTRRFGGTGLGLSISNQLVNLMDSKIKVESELGKGSCFSFIFNTKEAKQKSNIYECYENQVKELQSFTLEKHILIAEDNKINQIVAKKYLSRLGFKNISFADNGKIALQMALEKSYDYILMDMQMPIMDGVEACERIFDEIHFLDAPTIIAMTANNSVEDKKRCEKAGMVAFITKPLNIEDIKETIFKFEVDHKKAA